MKIYVKPAELKYLDEIETLERASFHVPWSKLLLQRLITDPDSMMIVAVSEDDLLLGYLGLMVMYDTAHIVNIAVAEQYRRAGIGKSLMDAAAAICLKSEIYDLTLEVRVSNTGATALYEKCGFTADGIRKGYYIDNHEDALIMSRKLGAENEKTD